MRRDSLEVEQLMVGVSQEQVKRGQGLVVHRFELFLDGRSFLRHSPIRAGVRLCGSRNPAEHSSSRRTTIPGRGLPLPPYPSRGERRVQTAT